MRRSQTGKVDYVTSERREVRGILTPDEKEVGLGLDSLHLYH